MATNRTYTTKEKLQNWLYYNWWIPVLTVFLLMAAASILTNAWEQDRSRADYRFAYIGTQPLPEEAVAGLEQAVAALGKDCNGDGAVTVSLAQYVTSGQGSAGEAMYADAAELALLADIGGAESYFYLLDNPEAFQQSFQLLAEPDGSPCEEDDFTVEGKVIPCQEIPLLSECMPQGLYLSRRCFPNPRLKENSPENAALWAAFLETAQ